MYNLSNKQSLPRHPKDRSGVCLVVGTHPDWESDYETALRSANDAGLNVEVCAINDATELVKADHVATCHPEHLEQFLAPVDYPVEIHTRRKLKKYEEYENQYIWSYNYAAGSSIFAAAAMLIIGYDLVILCGCPMNGEDGYAVRKHDEDYPRFGDEGFAKNTLDRYHYNLRVFKKDCPEAHKLRSMSGITKQIFGGF